MEGSQGQFPGEGRPGAKSPRVIRGQPSIGGEGRAEGTASGRA